MHINECTVAELTLKEQEFDDSDKFWLVVNVLSGFARSSVKLSFLFVDAVAVTPSKARVLFLKGNMEAKNTESCLYKPCTICERASKFAKDA